MEYNIGGKIFLKEGGRYVPKMQLGGWKEQIDGIKGTAKDTLNLGKNGVGDTPKRDWTMGADMLATGINSLAQKPNPGLSPRAGAMAKTYNGDTRIENGLAAGMGIAASLDPTGTLKAVDSVMKVGRAVGNVVDPGDEYGVSKSNAGKITSSILDPIGRLQQTYNVGKKHGFGAATKDFLSFGTHGNDLLKNDVKMAEDKDERDTMRMRQGMNQGAFRNDGIYAKMGAHIKPYNGQTKEPNVEIEDGEIVLGNPTQIGMRGNTSTSLESKYGAMFHGDKHGTDSDGDGLEGIPLTSGEAYVASEHLGLNGKKSGPGNKSVAQEMKPYLKYLNGGETNPLDPYKNNPVAIAETNRQLGLLKNEAEKGKFMEGIGKELKNKDRNVKDILSYITKNAPLEDLNSDELGQVQEASNQLINSNQNQQPMMYNQPQYRQGGYYFQQGGMAQPEANPSEERMTELVQETPSIDPSQGGTTQLSPEAQQMLQQLPPEMQEQIMALPPEQQEEAIMQAMQQQGQGQPQPGMEGAPPQGAPQDPAAMGMDPAAMMGGAPQDPNAPIDPAAAEMGMEGGQPVMKCGGRMYRNGDYIRMQMGGNIRQGRLNGMNAMTGAFNLH